MVYVLMRKQRLSVRPILGGSSLASSHWGLQVARQCIFSPNRIHDLFTDHARAVLVKLY